MSGAATPASNAGIDPQKGLCYPLCVAKKKLERELKKPDEFVSFWTALGNKISEHRAKVIVGIVVVVASTGIIWGTLAYRSVQAQKATAAFARIDRIALAGLLPEKVDENAKAEVEEESDVPRFKTEKERLEAAIQAADDFVAKFGNRGLGRRALLGKAGRLLALGKTSEAATLYETLAAGETDPSLRAIEQAGAAAAQEAAGKLDEALRAYTTLADGSKSNGGFYLDHALYAKARILEKQGKAKEAEQALRDILNKVPKTMLRQQIDDRLAILTEK
jgi:tetratricopeptide (TPR) repeat protein